jgi:hypothetical protein
MPSPGDMWGLHDGLQVVIQLNNNGQAIGVGSEKLACFGALLVKKLGLCPTQTGGQYPMRRQILYGKSCG